MSVRKNIYFSDNEIWERAKDKAAKSSKSLSAIIKMLLKKWLKKQA